MATRARKEVRVRAFRSCAMITIKERDDLNRFGFSYTRAGGIFQIRGAMEGVAEPEVLLKPYEMNTDCVSGYDKLSEFMKTLPIPGCSDDLDLLATDLVHELMMVSTKLVGKDPDHSYIIFIDIKANMEAEQDHYLENLTGEAAKEVLDACPGIYALRKSSKMREVKAAIETCVFGANFEEKMCSICLQEMSVGDKYGTTPCKHAFHVHCLGRWMWTSLNKKPVPVCPMCRQSLLV